MKGNENAYEREKYITRKNKTISYDEVIWINKTNNQIRQHKAE